MTYKALIFYTLGLLFYSLNRILVSLFYANKDTKTPVIISAYIVIINISLNIILMKYLQLAGLAFATSISAFLQFVILKNFLRKKNPEIQIPNIQKSVLKIFLISLLIFTFCYYLQIKFPVTGIFLLILKVGLVFLS